MIAYSLMLSILQAPSLNLTLMPSGLFDRIKGYAPYGTKFSEQKPDGLFKAPPAMNPQYGTIKLGDHRFFVMKDGETKLFVDENGDGDLTNDPAVKWAIKTDSNGKTSWGGSAQIDLFYEGKTVPCTIGLYTTNGGTDLGYYADFALSGKVELGGKSYDALYADPSASWDGKQGIFMIDKDADGKFNPNYEFFRATEPFNVAGTTYEMKGLTFAKSSKTVAERTASSVGPADPNESNGLRPGSMALPFRAKTTSGKSIALPSSFKGKIVMLDFWATWCGPCMREVPNVVKAYTTFHGKGFEVLGISLDREGASAQVKEVAAKNGMVWDQVYDGKFFQAAIAKQYGIQAIPEAYLVDGDTGRILAFGNAIRGEKLGPAIEKALAAKRRG